MAEEEDPLAATVRRDMDRATGATDIFGHWELDCEFNRTGIQDEVRAFFCRQKHKQEVSQKKARRTPDKQLLKDSTRNIKSSSIYIYIYILVHIDSHVLVDFYALNGIKF